MKKYIIAILTGVVLTIVFIFAFNKWLDNRPQYRFGNGRAAVIKQIQSVSRLETASFSIDEVIEASTNYDRLRQFLFGDKLLLVAHGKVIAGLDLSSMKAEDFAGFGTNITITLPQPQILNITLDNNQTRVFDRNQGLLTKGDLNLEAEARLQAESAIKQAACDGGILTEANINAKKQLEIIFKSAGFESVNILTKDGSCN
ncbi:MAG TPA: DUF4230 domain-containing protein [Verrucomicrobiae bacterium]|nr:DUF4230 domain-containing protein [Verrucomicrobiae bacterium]